MTSSQIVWSDLLLQLLKEDLNIKPPADLNLQKVLKNSEEFKTKFPIDSTRCKTLKARLPKEILERNCNSVYPLVHERILRLYGEFILFKRKFGTSVEKKLYRDLTILGLVDRLLLKRAVVFIGRSDHYVLQDGTEGFGNWTIIGTDKQAGKLKLKHYISYDEIKLSAFLSVSSFTHFINDGSRYNNGKLNRINVQDEGIIIGLIGARLRKQFVMEYQEMIISKAQNNETNGYGTTFAPTMKSLFAGFYEKPPFTYQQVLSLAQNEPDHFTKVNIDDYFDNDCFAKRVGYSFDTLLLEANTRAKLQGTYAFVHVVGIGLGVWRCSTHQDELFVQTCAKRIEQLGKNLDAVSDIYFSYINCKSIGSYQSGNMIPIEGHPKGGIKVFIGKREPHVKLVGEDEGKLLVASYAWDGNALPGNEFWGGGLSSSGDPAAAASTQIAELHNPHINPKVSAANLQVVTLEGVIPFLSYCENILKCGNNLQEKL